MRFENSIATLILLVLLLGFSWKGTSQETSIWTKLEAPYLDRTNEIEYGAHFKNFDSYVLYKDALIQLLENASFRFSPAKSNTIVEFPLSNGRMESFTMYQTEVMSSELAAKFSDIKTYVGLSLDNPANRINLTVTPYGVYGMIHKNGSPTYINPLSYHGNRYMVFEKHQTYTDQQHAFLCEVEEQLDQEDFYGLPESNNLVDNTSLRRYRLALACTGEYANFHLSQAGVASSAPTQVKRNAVMAAMVVTINRVNSIYERDVAVQLQLVDDNEDLIQLDPNTDPYTNTNGGLMLAQNQTHIDNTIGTANYDIGHVFSTGGAGTAQFKSVCNPNSKARGVTGIFSPVGDPFDIDYVAHEIGHQFGANHTFNNFCGGARTAATAMEPGSGSTIMAYTNICPPNIQSASDDYFHIISIYQIQDFISNSGGSTCSENIGLLNHPPTIDQPLPDYIIPNKTAFVLDVHASDEDGDVLTYTWEQLDSEVSTQAPTPFNTVGPNFRSIQPTTSSKRYFPELNTVLNGSVLNTWEVVPSVAREMEFGVVVRDNNVEGGQSDFDTTSITFVPGAPFAVTSQNTPNNVWEEGETKTITWNVANTNNAPINASEVDILLSTNVGQDFDVVLASGVPNNGSADVVVPSVFGPVCRIMVKGSNTIFYAVNAENFTINSGVNMECFDFANTVEVQIPDGLSQNQQGAVAASTIYFDQNGVIESLNLQVDISHTNIQDLVIQLVGPNDEFITLFDRDCSSEIGIAVHFNDEGATLPDNCPSLLSGTYHPANGSLNQWHGTNALGEWTLLIADFWDGDTGQLNAWTLEICTTNLSTINQEANAFFIVPNPNNGNFQISFPNLSGNELTGKLFDLQGRCIETIQLQAGLLQQEVQFENLQQGMYLFQIKNGENTFVEKLIIR